MSPSKLFLIATTTLLMSAAHAQSIRISVPDQVPLPASNVSRAELLADLHMWRLSGLQALHRGDRGPDFHSQEHQQAEAKYAWLRASPQYSALVAELSRRPTATVLAQRAGPDRPTVSFAN